MGWHCGFAATAQGRQDSAEAITLPHISRSYTMLTLVGLLSFAVLVNMDAILVKSFFDPETAGNYGVVVTLGKMNLFIPLALGMVLFPKAVDRQAKAVIAPVAAVGTRCHTGRRIGLDGSLFLVAEPDCRYGLPRRVCQSGFGAGNCRYCHDAVRRDQHLAQLRLSLRRTLFVAALAVIVVAQASAIVLFHDELQQVALILVAGGVAANWSA